MGLFREIGKAFKKVKRETKRVLKQGENVVRSVRDRVLKIAGEVSGVRFLERRRRRHRIKRLRAAEAAAVEKARDETARQLALARKAVENAPRPAAAASSSSSAPPQKSQELVKEAIHLREVWKDIDNKLENPSAAMTALSWNLYHLEHLIQSNDERLALVEEQMMECSVQCQIRAESVLEVTQEDPE